MLQKTENDLKMNFSICVALVLIMYSSSLFAQTVILALSYLKNRVLSSKQLILHWVHIWLFLSLPKSIGSVNANRLEYYLHI